MAKTVIAFDLFGTILSTASIAQELAELYGDDKARAIASLARTYQLEYTWRSNSMGIYHAFDELTRFSFRHAAAETGVELSAPQEERIMDAYNRLEPFPEVRGAFKLLEASPHLDAYVFSNGTAAMMTSFLMSSARGGLSDLSARLFPPAKVVSVDAKGVQVFKPDPRTYGHLLSVAGVGDDAKGSAWLVSSNPFDALGAVAAGMRAAWIDRTGAGWVDGLGGALGMRPTVVVRGVDEAVRAILEA